MWVDRLSSCLPRCGNELVLSHAAQEAADIFLAVVVAVCFAAAVAAVAFFAFNGAAAMTHPDRAVVFLCLAFVGLNVGYLFRAAKTREELSCQPAEEGGGGDVMVVTHEGHRDSVCFANFVFVYFFSRAVAAWFAIVVATFSVDLYQRGRDGALNCKVTPHFSSS